MNGRRYWVTAAVLLLAACGGDIQTLGEVAGGSSGSGGSAGDDSASGSGGTAPVYGGSGSGAAGSGGHAPVGSPTFASELDVCETDCFRAITETGPAPCKICHAANPAVRLDMGTLDMESPGISARLRDQPAAHKGTFAGSVCPQGDKIIDSAHPLDSWLLKKILGQQGTCGTVMPSTGALSAADQACMVRYVNCVADR